MYSLSSRALQLLQENEAEPEDDVAEPRRKRGRGGAASQQPKPATWTWVMTQLMDLMCQYPGGLAEAAILTELLQRRLRKQGKPDCAARSDPSPAALPAPTAAATAAAATAAAATAGAAVLATVGANHAAGFGELAALPRRMSLQALLKVHNKRGGAAEAQQHQQYGGAAAAGAGAAAGSPTLVVRVSDVECVAPPSKKWGTGAPYETQGGSWLLRLQEEEAYQREQREQQQQARGAGGCGDGGATATGRGAAGAAATAAMHLHSVLRLCVLGSTPLITAGSRVRIGAVPMRSCPSGPADTPCAARLLPSRALVPELPPALVGPAVAIWASSSSGGSSSDGSSSGGSSSGGGDSGGVGVAATAGTTDAKAWPRFDALQYGGCVNTLEEAVAGALAHVPPGSGKPLQGWLVARVAPAGVGPPRTTEAGVYDGRMRRTILLTTAFPASSPAQPDGSSNGSGSAAAGSSSNGTPLVLVGDQVALGDLLLPGELLAVYEPVAVVYEAATVATAATAGCGGSSGAATAAGGAGSPPGCGGGDGGTGRRWVEFTATADTLVTVLPPPPPAPAPSTSSLPPAVAAGAAVAGAVAGAGAGAALGEAGPAAMDVDAGPLAIAGRTAVASNSPQIGGRDQAEALAAVLPAAVAAAALPVHAAAGIAGLLSGGGARPAAALQHQHQLQLQPPPPQQQQPLLLLQPQQRTALVARVEAILGFASGSAKQTGGLLRLLLSDGSGGQAEAALQLARGSKLLSRVWPGHCLVLLGATLAPPHPPPPSPPPPARQQQQHQQHQQQHHPNQPPQRLQLRWVEGEAGAELHSLTAMPAATTTPGLVRYTSLEALRRAAVAATAAAAEPAVAEPAVAAAAAGPPRGVWPAAQLRALAAAAAQLPDPRASWRRQVPYLNLPYDNGCMGAATAAASGGAAMAAADLGVAAGSLATAAATADAPHGPEVAAAAAAGGGLLMAAHDGGCCSLAAVARIRSVRVATQRVHRACGRPASRVDLDFGFMDLDEEAEAEAAAGGAGAASGGGSGGASCGPAAAAPAVLAVQDTPSKDQRMDGLWHCALCGRDISAPEMEWAFAPGRLELLQPGEEEQQGQERGQQQGQQGQEREQQQGQQQGQGQQGQGQGQQGRRQEAAVEVVADPGALQGLLGLGAAAFHVLNTAGRQKAIERALLDAISRQSRRFVLSFYPMPPAAAAATATAAATTTTAAGTATAGHPIWQLQGGHPAGGAPPSVAAAAPLDFWAVAQIRGVDFA